MMPEFDRQWQKLGLNDEDLRKLQETLLQNPKAGPVVQGTGGLRKIRVAFGGLGKRGSGRVVYVDFAAYESVYLITAYAKNEKSALSKKERNEIAKVIIKLEQGLAEREIRK